MRKILFFFFLSAFPAAGAAGAETEPEAAVITVVASGVESGLAETGQQVTVIDAAEVAAVQGADLARVLQRVPGLTLSRNGGVGGFTGIRLRGAEAEQLLVLVDGVRQADAASPANGFDGGPLLAGGIARIEVLRSANSVIWGSQAIGGLLAVSTDGARPPLASVTVAAGSRRTATVDGVAGWRSGALTVQAQGGWFETAGASSAAVGREADGFRQWRAGGRAELALGDRLTAFGTGRMAHGRLALDGFPPPDYDTFGDTAEFERRQQQAGAAGLRFRGEALDLTASWSLADTDRQSFDPAVGSPPGYTTKGRLQRMELRGGWAWQQWRLRFGAERERSRFATAFDSRHDDGSSAGYVQAGLDGAVVGNVGLRVEHHARAGTISVAGADMAVPLGGDWRITTSWGQGFKAPSLFQLHSDYGNLALRPERSTAFDLGLAHRDRSEPGYFSITLFRRNSRDMIDFMSCYRVTIGICTDRPNGTYDNIGRTRGEGVEAEAHLLAVGRLGVRATYSFVTATNRQTGRALARRPRHAGTLVLDWAGAGVDLGADLRLVSASFDDAAGAVRLPGHAVLDLRASAPLGKGLALFGRVENAWDEEYQTAAGYGTPGRSLHIGARATW